MPPRSAYMKRPQGDFRINAAEQHGWGEGWPHCQRSQVVEVRAAGVKVTVRRELTELVSLLLAGTVHLHHYRLKAAQTGGFNCRPIGGTQKPSNHSWGLAVDLNWHDNPFQKPFRSNLPVGVVPMWWSCGFYWGGWYGKKPDPMHFEYIFRRADVARHLSKAKELIMPFQDDRDARALIWRVEGILNMRDTFDNHAGDPAEANALTAAIKAISADSKAAREAAAKAAESAEAAAESARAVLAAVERLAPPPA